MKDKKAEPRSPRPRVFLSSTYLDQAERRRHVIEALELAGVTAVAMERFAGVSRPPEENDVALVRTCDLYFGILAYRYGTPPPGHDISHTEIEYEAAKAAGIDRIVLVVDRHLLPMNPETDTDPLPERWKLQEKLQAFTERVRKEVTVPQFQSNEDLLNKVWHSISQWLEERGQKPTAQAPSATAHPRAEDVSRYRDAMLAEHGLLPMVGFASTVRAPIQTAALYVDLRATWFDHDNARTDPKGSGEAKALREDDERGIEMKRAFGEGDRRGCRCLVLRGYAGSGKTTFCKRLAVACVQEGGSAFGLAQQALPVLVTLRKLGASDHELPLAELIHRSLPAHLNLPGGDLPGFAAWLAEQRDYPLLLLFDGLDEVANEAARDTVAARIPQLLGEHSARHALLTSRFAGYTAGAQAALGEHAWVLDLQPFTEPQTEQFITNWYRIVECHYDAVAGALRAQEQATDLIERLKKPAVQASRVIELSANPLLLTILCIIHRDTRQLPEGRERLYREMVQVLLESWRRSKDLAVHLSAEQSLRVLMPVARVLHQVNGRTSATAAELEPVMAPPLAKLKWTGSAADFLRAIRDDSGLLTGKSGDSYGFLHLGIQEYLTARAIESELVWAMTKPEQQQRLFAEVAGHYGEPWWREVILLLLALPDRPFFGQLFEQVVERPGFGAEQALLDDCIQEASEAEARPFVEFLRRSAALEANPELRGSQVAAAHTIKTPDKSQLGPLGTLLAARLRVDRPLDKELRALLGIRDGDVAGPTRAVAQRVKAGIELVLVPAGEFLMGSPNGVGHSDEHPQRRVRLIQPFYLARTPVTNAQYRAFVEATKHPSPPSWRERRFAGDDKPVVTVSWDDAQAFCAWAGLRLPTEAEWEYACRAGTSTEYWSGDGEDSLARVGWYVGNSEGSTRPVGIKPSNPFGLRDMHGNVWEWCEDWKGDYSKAPSDGTAYLGSGSRSRVLRGGSWHVNARSCRSAYRIGRRPGVPLRVVGFRPASSSL